MVEWGAWPGGWGAEGVSVRGVLDWILAWFGRNFYGAAWNPCHIKMYGTIAIMSMMICLMYNSNDIGMCDNKEKDALRLTV